MIRKLKFSNFHSFRDETVIDFQVNNKTAHSYFDQELPDNSRVTKIMGVFGANGAGKSNLLRPIAFLDWFITSSFQQQKSGEDIPILAHVNANDEPSSFEIDFFITTEDHSEYAAQFIYKLTVNNKHVINEELKIKTSRLYSNIFSRQLNKNGSYTIKTNKKYLPIETKVLNSVPSNCSLTSYINQISKNSDDMPYELSLVDYFFINTATNIYNVGHHRDLMHIQEALEIFTEEPELFEQAKKLLMQYDIGITDITFETQILLKENGEQVEKAIPFCTHSNRGKTFKLPLFLESTGTQSAFKLLASITSTLKIGGIAVLDEFDNDLHPLLTNEIIELFMRESSNPNGAQLIFASHSAETLKLLRKQHVYLTEKQDGESEAWRADEIEGLKERDNLYAKYITGALGGVPSFE